MLVRLTQVKILAKGGGLFGLPIFSPILKFPRETYRAQDRFAMGYLSHLVKTDMENVPLQMKWRIIWIER